MPNLRCQKMHTYVGAQNGKSLLPIHAPYLCMSHPHAGGVGIVIYFYKDRALGEVTMYTFLLPPSFVLPSGG